jgi:hypothetical protein
VSLSPVTGVLANLFDVGVGYGQGGLYLGGNNFSLANQAFGPESFTSINQLLQPQQLMGFERGLGGVGQSGLDLFNQQGLPALQELLGTGFRTDVDPIRQEELRRFRRETVPGIAEQFAGQTGTFSTDFLSAVTNAGADISSQIGALQTQLDEAASGRRAEALLGGGLSAPAEFGAAQSTLGEQLRLQEQGATEGGQALALLQALSGVVPTGAIAISPKQKSAQGGVL